MMSASGPDEAAQGCDIQHEFRTLDAYAILALLYVAVAGVQNNWADLG